MTGTTPPAPAQGPPSALPAADALARAHMTGAAASTAFALAWLRLSWWHPALTYHFGPPLAAAAWPVLLRARLRPPARRGQALAAAGGGFLVAMAALGVAVAGHWLRGPTLIGAGSVPAEEVMLAVVAAAWGWRVAERRRRAWFLPAGPSSRHNSPRPQSPANDLAASVRKLTGCRRRSPFTQSNGGEGTGRRAGKRTWSAFRAGRGEGAASGSYGMDRSCGAAD
jgi:hypothetical protein